VSKRRNAEGCSLHLVAQCLLVFWCQEWLLEGRPCPGKIWVQRLTPVKTAEVYTFRLNSGTVIDSGKVQFTVDHGFSNERSIKVVRHPELFQKWDSDTQIVVFLRNFHQKPLKVCYKVSLSKKLQRQSCSAVTIQWYQHFGRGWPLSCKIWA